MEMLRFFSIFKFDIENKTKNVGLQKKKKKKNDFYPVTH